MGQLTSCRLRIEPPFNWGYLGLDPGGALRFQFLAESYGKGSVLLQPDEGDTLRGGDSSVPLERRARCAPSSARPPAAD